MQTVHIYVESDTPSPRSAQRMAGYILECTVSGKIVTKERFQEVTATYNQTILLFLNEALSRINRSCEVHIHTQNIFILNMVDNYVDLWAGGGFCNKKGEPIKNQELWSRYFQLSQKHLIVPEAGRHSYLDWITDEMMRIKNESVTRNT